MNAREMKMPPLSPPQLPSMMRRLRRIRRLTDSLDEDRHGISTWLPDTYVCSNKQLLLPPSCPHSDESDLNSFLPSPPSHPLNRAAQSTSNRHETVMVRK
uniref:CARMIL_C domain-containing protein n=1 Tax=Steinernema glaseri TaxID=37863 RepID=A0A1I7YAX0_9BILA